MQTYGIRALVGLPPRKQGAREIEKSLVKTKAAID
jgi:hypothetical protein